MHAWQATRPSSSKRVSCTYLVHSSTFLFFFFSVFHQLFFSFSLTFSVPFAVLSVVSKENENRKPKAKTAERQNMNNKNKEKSKQKCLGVYCCKLVFQF